MRRQTPRALWSEAVEEAAAPVSETEAGNGIKKMVKDASAQVDKLPGTKQVKDVSQ